ncbi:hypothetical protein D9M72_298590 [compost metagenome]
MHRVEEVHADEVLRTLQGLRQVADGDGGGVGSNDGVFTNVTFHFSQHGVLDLRVLDHGLDHDVDVAEIAIGHGRTDRVQGFSHLLGLHAALFDALAEQLGSFLQTHLDTLFADILHQDRSALGGGLVGDAAPHDASTEHGSQFHVPGGFVVLLAFFLQLLVIQEQADQAGGNRSLGQLHETGGFDFQRLVTTEVGRFLDGLDGFYRGGVVRTGLASDEALGGLESHHLFDGIELELFQLGLALGLEVQLAGDGALGQVQGGSLQQLGSDHGVDGADFQGVFGTVFLAGGDPLDGVIGTDDARQAHGTAEARVNAQFDFRQTDLGCGAHHAVIGCQTHFQAATQGDAVDGCNGGDFEVFEGAEDLVGFEVAGNQFFVGQPEVVDEFGDIGADDEDVLAAADNHALDRSIGLDGCDCITQFVQGETVELVDGLTLEVEFQFDDTALKSLNRDGFTFVNHQLISTVWETGLYASEPTGGLASRRSRSIVPIGRAHPPIRYSGCMARITAQDKRLIHTPV